MPQLGLGLGLQRANRALFRGLLDQYGGAAAAYSLRALSSGWLAGDVVEVRPSHGAASQSFTASQITSGAMLDFVNSGTADLYGNRMYFDGVDDSIDIPSVTLSGDFTLKFSMPRLGNTGMFFSDTGAAGGTRLYMSTGSIRWTGESNTTDGIFHGSTADILVMELIRVGSTISLYTNGILSGTATDSQTFIINSIGEIRSDGGAIPAYNGTIWDVEVDGVTYTGGGVDASDWNGITPNGSPALFTGQNYDGFVSTEYDQSGATVRDGTQITTTEQIKIVDAGAVVLDGNGNTSTLWDGIDDDLDVLAGFAGLTAANVYAVTDNAGVVTLSTLTAQDISLATNLSTILTSLTYDKVTALVIYPDATDQAGIEAALSDLFE